jgi:hypothetical protein
MEEDACGTILGSAPSFTWVNSGKLQMISGSVFEPGTSQIQSRNATHLMATKGECKISLVPSCHIMEASMWLHAFKPL